MAGIKIAHISDMHFTSSMVWPPPDNPADRNLSAAWARLTKLKDSLVEEKPDAIMVTGDIADYPAWELSSGNIEQAWTNARDFLEAAGKAIFPDKLRERLFVVPGNHDLRVLGIISRPELTDLRNQLGWFGRYVTASKLSKALLRRVLGEQYAAVEPILGRGAPRGLGAAPGDPERFAAIFGDYLKSRHLPDLGIFVFCVDSNLPSGSLLNLAQGAVGQNEFAAMKETADKWVKMPEYIGSYKLVLMHHHPLPIAGTEGLGPRIEGEEFNLMRNASTFLAKCADFEIDFVLHGHKHYRSSRVVSFPERDLKHSVVVLGAGSVQSPIDGHCSYNVIRQRDNGEWLLDVHKRRERQDDIQGYDDEEGGGEKKFVSTLLLGPERHRQLLRRSSGFPIGVRRLEVIATIDKFGNATTRFYARDVVPLDGKEYLDSYPVISENESQFATLEAIGFEDTETSELNALSGFAPIAPAAKLDRPGNTKFGIRGTGIFTFSQEYCQWYKGIKFEKFSLDILKQYDEVYIDIQFLEPDLWPHEPQVLVTRAAVATSHIHDEAHRLRWEEEDCAARFRQYPDVGRLSLLIRAPLPNATYHIVWKLAEDEYEILTDSELQHKLRGAISGLRDRFLTVVKGAAFERGLVQQFLKQCGEEIFQHCKIREPLRIDLAVHDPADGKLKVVTAMQVSADGTWQESTTRPQSPLGGTLRGKAYLQRAILSYAPGIEDSKKNPNRDPIEEQTKHQMAIPLVYPPELPFYPRVGVLTFSSEEHGSGLFDRIFDTLREQPADVSTIFDKVHGHLIKLAQDIKVPLPGFEIKSVT